jgi:hypothetical protein
MKSVRHAAAAALLGVACLARADADPASTSSTSSTSVTASSGDAATPAKSGTQITDLSKDMLLPSTTVDHPELQPLVPAPNIPVDTGLNATINLNADADLPLLKPVTRQPTQGEIEAYLQRQAEAAKNKDWLVRGYEQQLESRRGKNDADQSTNLYYELSTDKELAKLAGLPTLELPADAPVTTPRTGVNDSDNGALVLREDPSQKTAKSNQPDIAAFKPLINPKDPALINTWNNPYASLPYEASPSYDATRLFSPDNSTQDNSTTADSTPKTSDVNIPTTMETPGLIASQSDPLSKDIAVDLSTGFSQQDSLPQDSFELGPPKAPPDTDASQLQLKYNESLGVPGSLKNAGTQPQQLANPPMFKLPSNAEPVVQTTQPTPVRRPIADPLVIPYR